MSKSGGIVLGGQCFGTDDCPNPKFSAVSPCGEFFASIVSLTSSDKGGKLKSLKGRALRSWLRIWRCKPRNDDDSLPADTAAAYRAPWGSEWGKCELHFQKQFPSQSLTCVMMGWRLNTKEAIVFVGSESGMVTALECSSGNVLFSLVLDPILSSHGTNGNEEDTEVVGDAPALTNSGNSGVSVLTFLPEQQQLAVLVASRGKYSSVFLLNIEDGGSTDVHLEFQRPYGIMQTLSVSLSEGDERKNQSFLLLGCSSESVGVTSCSVSFVLVDLNQRQVVAKFVGGGSSFTSVTVDSEAGIIVATSSSESQAQHQILTIWKTKTVAQLKHSGKKTKIHPWGILSHHDSISQLLVIKRELVKCSAAKGDDNNENGVNENVTSVIALSNCKIFVWNLDLKLSTLPSGVIPVRIETGHQRCFFERGHSSGNLVPEVGAWYFHLSCMNSFDRLGCERSKEGDGSMVGKLLVVRGSIMYPFFQNVVIPSEIGVRSDQRHLFLPLKPTCDVVIPLCKEKISADIKHQKRDLAPGYVNITDKSAITPDDVMQAMKRRKHIGESSTLKHENEIHTNEKTSDNSKEQGANKQQRESGIGGGLRQALATSDIPMLETLLHGSSFKKSEISASVSGLSSTHALTLLGFLIRQLEQNPAASTFKGLWVEELIKHHAPSLAGMPEGRKQLMNLQEIVQERKRVESALVKLKGRVELLVFHMQKKAKLCSQQMEIQNDAVEPLLDHQEH